MTQPREIETCEKCGFQYVRVYAVGEFTSVVADCPSCALMSACVQIQKLTAPASDPPRAATREGQEGTQAGTHAVGKLADWFETVNQKFTNADSGAQAPSYAELYEDVQHALRHVAYLLEVFIINEHGAKANNQQAAHASLVQEMETYLRHRQDCTGLVMSSRQQQNEQCTCGLAALLRRSPDPETEQT